ncbi:protein-L-isoaspartate(D-aspartate) O-methyltransferase [bacterium]|nr:protein-L-isoaspartate(D-aspartate) O-methyltransferase [bacterium]
MTIAAGGDRIAKRRNEMVIRQLEARGVCDARVLAAMARVPRETFVGDALASRAYDDAALPIGERQTISQPYIVAVMAEALHLAGKEKVLEIGAGSGYLTAILARLADRVFSIERSPRLGRDAERRLVALGHHNVLLRIGDGTCGWPEHAPYDAIVCAAYAAAVPEPLAQQLAVGGRLVIPIGDENDQQLVCLRKRRDGLIKEILGPCRFVPLVGRYGVGGRR